MDTMHPVMRQCLAAQPFIPPLEQDVNDDDLYVVDVRTHTVIKSYGASSETARVARVAGLEVRPGQALLKGMQLRSFGVVQ